VNWRAITKAFVCLFLADFAAGFIAGDSNLFVGLFLSFLFSSFVFALLAYRQASRPFLHSALAFLCYFAFSQLLGMVLPGWLSSPPLVGALSWLTSLVALVFGACAGWLARANRPARADA
jgi:hypothetical protein